MKNFLIVFTDPHLPYSPTVLNLFRKLKHKHRVTLITPEPERLFSLQKIEDPEVLYLQFDSAGAEKPGLISKIARKIANKISPPDNDTQIARSLQTPRTEVMINKICGFQGEIIAVDFMALWCVQQAGRTAHLISLEIHTTDLYRNQCSFAKIKSVLIQTEERYFHLFHDLEIPRFLVQNAPPFLDFKPDVASRVAKQLVFCGSAVPGFGIFSCLDFISDFPEYQLTIKGAVPPPTREAIDRFYKTLLVAERIIIDDSYMDADTLTRYISKFSAGFVFYDFYRFDHLRTFNYYTAPSGKMFQYFNSGVPAIGNKLPGLEVIKTANAGVIIPTLSSVQIKLALEQIEASYESMAINAKDLSKRFDFSTNITNYLVYLENCS